MFSILLKKWAIKKAVALSGNKPQELEQRNSTIHFKTVTTLSINASLEVFYEMNFVLLSAALGLRMLKETHIMRRFATFTVILRLKEIFYFGKTPKNNFNKYWVNSKTDLFRMEGVTGTVNLSSSPLTGFCNQFKHGKFRFNGVTKTWRNWGTVSTERYLLNSQSDLLVRFQLTKLSGFHVLQLTWLSFKKIQIEISHTSQRFSKETPGVIYGETVQQYT